MVSENLAPLLYQIITLPLVTYADLSTLLQLLAHRYKDLDIRDRSRFYHQLLLTVSGEKVNLYIDAYIAMENTQDPRNSRNCMLLKCKSASNSGKMKPVNLDKPI